jgi:hypothetical protein
METVLVKSECEDPVASTSQKPQNISTEEATEKSSQPIKSETKVEVKYFQCEICALRESYDYFGNDPPFVKQYKFLENAYVIEDPFVPPKQGEFIILGTQCIKCGKNVCKDTNCSFYYDGTYCIYCAKNYSNTFPQNVQEKLKRIVT